MIDQSSTLALKARYVFPVSGPPIADGFVAIRGEYIETVGSRRPDGGMRDLGDAAIVPGLVNAHTHLEFSDLAAPLGAPGTPLPDWIRQVLAHRRVESVAMPEQIRRGLSECLAAGTTAVGEIATLDWRQDPVVLADGPPAVCMFYESIAPTTSRVAASTAAAEAFLSSQVRAPHVWPGLSPHAPYTVHPKLLEALVDLSIRYQVPMAMHLAESREELELLRTRGGSFRALLNDLETWDPRPAARYPRILDYLQQLARAPRSLVIHGNYLDGEERTFLADHADTMTVVYCPRTHHFFRHDPYPLAEMLASGIAVALGTDSRASNPDLSLFEEMRFIVQHIPHFDPSTVLKLGTLAGARALGLDTQLGSLEPGKMANLGVIDLAGGDADDPHAALFSQAARPSSTWIAGIPTAGSS